MGRVGQRSGLTGEQPASKSEVPSQAATTRSWIGCGATADRSGGSQKRSLRLPQPSPIAAHSRKSTTAFPI